MAVQLYKERDAIVVSWDKGSYEGPVRLVMSSNEDVSETELVSNQGFAAVSFPKGEIAGFHCEVFGNEGNLIDVGDVEI